MFSSEADDIEARALLYAMFSSEKKNRNLNRWCRGLSGLIKAKWLADKGRFIIMLITNTAKRIKPV